MFHAIKHIYSPITKDNIYKRICCFFFRKKEECNEKSVYLKIVDRKIGTSAWKFFIFTMQERNEEFCCLQDQEKIAKREDCIPLCPDCSEANTIGGTEFRPVWDMATWWICYTPGHDHYTWISFICFNVRSVWFYNSFFYSFFSYW